MIAMALQFFGLFHGFHRAAIGFGGSTLALSLRSLLATRSRAAPIALGVFNGFLPCPLVYAFAAQAGSTAAPLPGFLVMLAFGLGTFPAMLTMGGIGRVLAPVWRQRGVWLAGSFILLLGVITIGRGVVPFAAHHAHAAAAEHDCRRTLGQRSTPNERRQPAASAAIADCRSGCARCSAR